MKKDVLKFKSKIGWLVALIYLSLITPLILIWALPYQHSLFINIFATCFLSIVLIIFTWAVFSSYYLLTDDCIIAVTGPFKLKVYYDKIKDIRLNKSIWSSFSLSFDRVLIVCGNNIFSNYYFSPINKELFIESLKNRIAKNKNKKSI